MRKFLLTVAALLIAGAASAQPIGVKLIRDDTNGRLLLRGDDGAWLLLYGSGTPSFTTFLSGNVPANTIYFNTATATPYYFSGGSWTAASGGSAAAVTPGTTTVGSVAGNQNCFVYSDATNLLRCSSSFFVANDSGAGNGKLTSLRTPSGGSATSNFFNVTGTMPTGATTTHRSAVFSFTTAGTSVQAHQGLYVETKAGINSAASVFSLVTSNAAAGQNTGNPYSSGGNYGVYTTTTGTGSVVYNTGGRFEAIGAGTGNTGVLGIATSATGTPLINVGVAGYALNGSAKNVGVLGVLYGSQFYNASSPAVPFTSAGFFSNGAVAAPILAACDNVSELPTTGASSCWAVLDGAWPQAGNGVLTNGTMTAETQARESGSMIHSYTWTNAMIVALGAVGNGDITVATLPAKTVVKNAYVVIITPDTSANNLTVACGRTGATFLDYIGNSDAKAVANTVYGDASGERGANLTGYDLPSYTTTTDVKCHFIKTTTTLDTVLGSTGRVILETSLVP